jgi:hypothetical protein
LCFVTKAKEKMPPVDPRKPSLEKEFKIIAPDAEEEADWMALMSLILGMVGLLWKVEILHRLM